MEKETSTPSDNETQKLNTAEPVATSFVTPPIDDSATPATSPPSDLPPKPENNKPKLSPSFVSALKTVLILLIAPLLAIFITAFVFQSYEVDGTSMKTTLNDHDRLIIWKLPRTWARLTGNDYTPKRGDVVVFNKIGLHGYETKEKQLIKRVLGLPGERVVVADGVLTIFNKEHPEGFMPDQTLPYGSVIDRTEGTVDITLSAGQLFVCGDNRSASEDSRFFGPILAKDIIGKLAARILPLSDAEKF